MMTLIVAAAVLPIAIGGLYLIAVLLLERLESAIEPLYDWQAERDFCRPVPAIGSRRIAVVCTCGFYRHSEPIRGDRQQQAYDAALGAFWDEHGQVMV